MQALHAIIHFLVVIGLSLCQIWFCDRILSGEMTWWMWVGFAANTGVLVFGHFVLSIILHEGIHYHLSKARWLNETLVYGCGFFTYMIPVLYRDLHWRHHATPNEPDDWELIPETLYDLDLVKRRRALLRLMILGGYERTRLYNRMLFSKKFDLKAEVRRRGKIELVALEGARIGVLVGTLILCGWWLGWVAFFLAFAVPAMLGGILTIWLQLTEHFGAGQGNTVEATRDVEPRGVLQRFLYFLMFNINYHAIHHETAYVRGHDLPGAHARWMAKLEEKGKAKPEVYGSYREAVRAMWPKLIGEVRGMSAQRSTADEAGASS